MDIDRQQADRESDIAGDIASPRQGANTLNWTPYLFIAPALIIVAAVSLYPIAYQVYLSFTDWYLLNNPDPVFTGLDGYRRLLSDSVIWTSLVRTAYWTIGTVALEYVIALPLALLLNRPFRLNGILTGLILLPWVTPSIVVAYTWQWLLDSNYGIVHAILQTVGIVGERSVLSDPSRALPAVIVISAWKGAPFMAVALLATLKSIPHELYEAAAIDGAGRIRQFRDITLPLLRRVTVVTALVLGILAFYSFDIIWILTKGGPSDSTQLIGIYLFRSFFERLEFSYAATMGVSMLLLLIVFSGIYLRVLGGSKTDA
jgi:multiple sugar transport system permease protein